ERLGAAIRASTVPVVAWVGPVGARAEGDALFLVYSSDLAAMAPGAGIGPGRPFDPATRVSKEPLAEVAEHARALEALAAGSGTTASGVRRAVNAALPAGPARSARAVA